MSTEMDTVDLYKILCVSKSASSKDIQKAFYRLSLRHHPDRSYEEKHVATEKFQIIEEAYRLLANKQTRTAYDMGGIENARAKHIDLMYEESNLPETKTTDNSPTPPQTSSDDEETAHVKQPSEERNKFSNMSSDANPQPTTSGCSNTETRNFETSLDQEMTNESDDEVIIIYERIHCPEPEVDMAESSELTTSSKSENSDEESLPSDISLKSCEWLVDEILDRKIEGETTMYLIKWIGSDERTWEPKENLTGCKLALRKFHRKERSRMMREKLKKRGSE